jgi:hypothetical protein
MVAYRCVVEMNIILAPSFSFYSTIYSLFPIDTDHALFPLILGVAVSFVFIYTLTPSRSKANIFCFERIPIQLDIDASAPKQKLLSTTDFSGKKSTQRNYY